MKTVVDKFGRVVIPKRIRTHLGFSPGTEVDIEEEENRLVMEPSFRKPLLVKEGALLVYNGRAIGDLRNAVKTAREKRDEKFIRQFKGTK